jgi:NAD(P)-dependent dehydrogenase (short-subunit alcohol dehydrogenase family)
MNLDGKTALVTGAGRRVGRALAVALGKEGMRVAVHYNASASGAKETRTAIQSAGGDAELFQADLSSPRGPASLIDEVGAKFGTLAVVINSAAVMDRTPFGAVTPEVWDAMFALNLRAPFMVSQAAAPLMREEGGVIVNIADLAAFESWPAYVPHSISKAGIVKMTSALARVLAPSIRVNAIAPGAVLLPEGWEKESGERLESTTPLQRLGDPEDVVQAMLYLLRADYVTGETIIVDGGRHVRK